MITNEKIKIYLRYKGDIDGFTIVGTPDEKAVIAENEFYEVRDLTQDIILMKRNLVSKEYAKRVMNKIKENEINQEMVELLFNTFSN